MDGSSGLMHRKKRQIIAFNGCPLLLTAHFHKEQKLRLGILLVNPQRMCLRVTVPGLCVCTCVCYCASSYIPALYVQSEAISSFCCRTYI